MVCWRLLLSSKRKQGKSEFWKTVPIRRPAKPRWSFGRSWPLLHLISYSLLPKKFNSSRGLKIVSLPGVSCANFRKCFNWDNWLRSQTAFCTSGQRSFLKHLNHMGMLCLICCCSPEAFMIASCLYPWSQFNFVYIILFLLKRLAPGHGGAHLEFQCSGGWGRRLTMDWDKPGLYSEFQGQPELNKQTKQASKQANRLAHWLSELAPLYKFSFPILAYPKHGAHSQSCLTPDSCSAPWLCALIICCCLLSQVCSDFCLRHSLHVCHLYMYKYIEQGKPFFFIFF